MKEKIKELLRKLLVTCKIDLTKNLKYDRLTGEIMRRVITKDSNCIDIGAHKGEILEEILHLAPQGNHFAFEPIPHLVQQLQQKFGEKVCVHDCALADYEGNTTFNFVKNAPAYSGLRQRKYAVEVPEIEEIPVAVNTLDNLISSKTKIHFIKIDVEGGEFGVLKGADELLKRDKPYVVFECGLGASDFYGTSPKELYEFIQDIGLQLSTLDDFIKNRPAMELERFLNYYNSNSEYYFIIHPEIKK